MKAMLRAALAAVLAVVALAAQAADKVKVGYIALPSHAPSFIAKEKGYYAAEGLDAELVPFQAAQAMAVAIASGDIDFGVTAVSGGLLNLAARGDAVRIFGGALEEADGVPGHKILASKAAFDAGLQSPMDLDGKRFAITTQGSSFEYMGAQIAAKVEAKVKTVALNNMPAIAAALQAGKVDVAVAQPATRRHRAQNHPAGGDAGHLRWLPHLHFHRHHHAGRGRNDERRAWRRRVHRRRRAVVPDGSAAGRRDPAGVARHRVVVAAWRLRTAGAALAGVKECHSL